MLQVGGIISEALWQGEIWQQWLAELDFHLATLCDPQRVVAGHLYLGEQLAHLASGLEVVVIAMELETIGVAHERSRLHAEQCVVSHRIFSAGVMAVVGGQQRGTDALGDLEQLRVGAVLLGDPVVLDLHEQIVSAKDVLETRRRLERRLLIAPKQMLQHVATEAAGGGNDAFAVLLEQVPVQPGLVVVALHEGPAGELDQVAVARVTLGQQRQVVVELLAATGISAGVVHPAAAARALQPGIVGHVRLGAQNGLDSLCFAGLVERQNPVHVAVIGNAERRLAICRCRGHHLIYPGGTIEHGVLGVHVQVGERIAHDKVLPTRFSAFG